MQLSVALLLVAFAGALFYLLTPSYWQKRRSELVTQGFKVPLEIPGKLPFVGHVIEIKKDMVKFHKQATKLAGGQPFLVHVGPLRNYVLPAYAVRQFFDDAQFDFEMGIKRLLFTNDTFGGRTFDDFHHLKPLRTKFNPHLSKYSTTLTRQTQNRLSKLLALPKGETTVVVNNVRDFSMELVAVVSAASLIGDEYCEDQQVIDTFKYLTSDIDAQVVWMQGVPSFLQKWGLGRIEKHKQVIYNTTLPVIEKRRKKILAARQARPDYQHDTSEEQEIFLDYMIERALDEPELNLSDKDLADYVINLIFGMMSTTSNSIFHLLYDSAPDKQIRDFLYEEQVTLLEQFGTEINSKASFEKMRRLESAVKESLRMATGTLGLMQEAKDDILVGEYVIPKGEFASFSTFDIHYDEKIYPDPYTFKPDRFVDKPIHVSPEYLTWGLGKHACPGRFFALYVVKTIMGEILRGYDYERADGSRDIVPLEFVLGNAVERPAIPLRFTPRNA